jgi:hypothetical protein
MELTPERLVAQLGNEPLRPAYLVAGAELLRVLEAVDGVRAQARAQGVSERSSSARPACSRPGACSRCICPAAGLARKAPSSSPATAPIRRRMWCC